MVEERDGWFVVNVKDATWKRNATFGMAASFEPEGQPFPQTGVRLFVIEPGKSNCRYHREEAQEDFLVLSGQCKLLVNGQEKLIGPWDYVHCPPGVTHVFVGAGDAPCAFLAIGARPGERVELFYPESEMAAQYNAEAPEPTPDPRVAYSDVAESQPIDAPPWPLR